MRKILPVAGKKAKSLAIYFETQEEKEDKFLPLITLKEEMRISLG